jgi:signal transduction histidine kinase
MIHILLVEADSTVARVISDLYNHNLKTKRPKYRFTIVRTIAEALNLLSMSSTSAGKYDAIISDETLPDARSIYLITNLRHAALYLPLIVIGTSDNDHLISVAMKAGIQDYLRKDHLESETLQRATRYAIERQKAQNLMTLAVENASHIQEEAKLLNQQKKQLIELNRAKDEFISLSSHQLRTPATSVKQYLGMVLEGFAGKVPAHLRVFLRTAYDSNERQLTIINDLLKAAQVTSEKYALRKEKTDVSNLIKSVLDDYMPIIRIRKQHVNYTESADCEARIDAGEIRLVLANLIENASKYSPEGTTITVTAKCRKSTIKIMMQDQGVGIPPTEVKKIFEKFIRIDNELSDTVSGSGLGLYFVRRIVRLHGGRIKVDSELGNGSTFIVTLPL